jgi:2-oxoglutarate ferredoxin oxidoreductase subunit beta
MKESTKQKVWVSGTPKLWIRHPQGGRQCPGCHHPIFERAVCEVLEEMGIAGNTIGVPGVGCGARMFMVVNVDFVTTAHGRPPDVATAVKRIYPDRLVYTYQGDGDCLSIGMGSFMSAAARGEKFTIIMSNNSNYGTTGGQMAPTTLMGQKTTTTPEGRAPIHGYPIHAAELIVPLKGVVYSARTAVNNPTNYQRTKKYLKTAFQKQFANIGLTFVEVLSACPADWHMTPLESLEWMEQKMVPEYPLGEFKNVDKIE